MKKADKGQRFRTHIPEPRWQQVVSLAIVIIGIIIWLLFAVFKV